MYDDKNEFPNYVTYPYKGKRLIGYDIELAYHIASRLGVELEIRRDIKNFTELCRSVSRGEADVVISKLTIDMDRGQYVRFTDPYVSLRIGLLINRLQEVQMQAELKAQAKSDAKPDNILELLNRPEARIAVQKGTTWVAKGKDLFPKAQLVEYPDMQKAVDAVETGEAVAFLNDEWNIAANLKMNPKLTVRVRLAFVPGTKSGLAMAVSPDSPNLQEFLNLMIQEDGMVTTTDALLKKYFADGSASAVAGKLALAALGTADAGVPMAQVFVLLAVVLALTFIWLLVAYRTTSTE
jgi:ABC-type amino acid transport substrate-binding protein